MTLSNVEAPVKKWGIGYKSVREVRVGVFESYDNLLCAGYKYGKVGKWAGDTNEGPIKTWQDVLYEPGFHIMMDKKRALNLHCNGGDICVVKVRFRKAAAGETGDLLYGDVVVAKEMMIVGKV